MDSERLYFYFNDLTDFYNGYSSLAYSWCVFGNQRLILHKSPESRRILPKDASKDFVVGDGF